MKWTPGDLEKQYRDAALRGWIHFFRKAALTYGFDASLLLAIASRETNVRQIKGDWHDGEYHGFGLMQIDCRTDPEFCANWKPEQAEASIERGAAILAAKRQQLAAADCTDLRAIVAAYNAGAAAVLRALRAKADPDFCTTGDDYGADVLARDKVFKKLLLA
jgi:ABC-type xylose transport system substrate-binding protein